MRKCLIILAAVVALTALCISLFSQEYAVSGVQNGDVNMDGQICMDDSMQIIYHLWRDGRDLSCPDAADVDRSGTVDVNDVIGSLRYIFFGAYIPDCPIECNSGY